jgi:hypothetical protein
MSYDDWLMSGTGAKEYEEIYMERRIGELLDAECDPDNLDNLVEALSEASEDDRSFLEDLLAQKDLEKFGLRIWAISLDYMEKRAEHYAQLEIEQGDHL